MSASDLQIFVDVDAPSMLATMLGPTEYPPDMEACFREANLGRGVEARVLFCGEGNEGFSLAAVEVAPNYVIIRHSHSADCLYYVSHGEITLGNRTLGKGDGFFVAADQPYTYQAGPEGAEVLEMRVATTVTTRVAETNPDRIAALGTQAHEQGEAWRAWLDERHSGRQAAHRESVAATS